MSLDSAPSLSDLLKKLKIPADYARIDDTTSTILELDHWKQGVHSVLDQILRLVKSDEELSLEDQGHIIFASSPFAIDFSVPAEQHEKNPLDNWTTLDARQSAQGTLIFVFYNTDNKMNLLPHSIFRSTCFSSVFIAISSTSGTGPCLQLETHLQIKPAPSSTFRYRS
jgi:hypothetical protein